MSAAECAETRARLIAPQERNPGPVRDDRRAEAPEDPAAAAAAPWPKNEVLADYVRGLADRMHLRDWTIYTSDDPAEEPDQEAASDDTRCASFEGTLGRRSGRVWVNREWWDEATPEERRQTIVHELTHAHEHGPREIVIHIVSTYPKRTADALQGIFDAQMEYAVDTLADVIAEGMPLPPEGA